MLESGGLLFQHGDVIRFFFFCCCRKPIEASKKDSQPTDTQPKLETLIEESGSTLSHHCIAVH